MLEEFQARESKALKQELEKSDSTHPDSQKDDPPKKDCEAFNLKSLLIKKTDSQLLQSAESDLKRIMMLNKQK